MVSLSRMRDIPHNIYVPIPNVYSVEWYGKKAMNVKRRIWKEAVSYPIQRHLGDSHRRIQNGL